MTQHRPSIYARRRSTTEWRIQLHFGGAASPAESSAETATEDGGRGVGGTLAALHQDVRQAGTALYRSRKTVAGAVAASALHHPQRAAVDGAIGLQHAVPLVRGAEHGRPHLGRDGVYQEPRAAAERRHRAGVLSKGTGTGARTESAVGGSLHGGRNVDRSLGGTEEFSTQRAPAATARRRRQQSDRKLSRRETQQSDAPVHYRSGSDAVSEVGWRRFEAELSGAGVDGEPQRIR